MMAAAGCTALLPALLVAACLCPLQVSAASRPSWWSCVRDIGLYFEPTSDTEFTWAVNPCGYSALQVEDVRRGVYFSSDNISVSFAGDSTALRAYVFAVNTYLPPLNIPVIRKVATVPRVMTHVAFGAYDGENRKSLATFYNMRYVSTSAREIEEGILGANGGVMVITLGNWDLNWKLQKNSPMPLLRGPVHNLEVAKAYWTEHVGAMMANIARCLGLQAPAKRPLIVFREQFLPNCDASRFTSKKARYRRCAPLIRPIVVPLYRRVLAPLAWSLNIPVVPMDHVFKENYKYCAMGDGIHLNFNCMMTEQQHIWNVALLLRRHRVRQGLGTVSHESGGLPSAKLFLNESVYEAWRRSMDMVPSTGVAAPLDAHALQPDADVSVDATKGTKDAFESEVPGADATEGDTSPSPQHEPPQAHAPPIGLTVVVTDQLPSADHHAAIQSSLQWHQVGTFVLSSVLLVSVALYMWWAASGPRKEWPTFH